MFMNSILLAIHSQLEVTISGISYDVSPVPFVLFGLLGFIVIAGVIIGLIILSVKILKRIKSKNMNTPQ